MHTAEAKKNLQAQAMKPSEFDERDRLLLNPIAAILEILRLDPIRSDLANVDPRTPSDSACLTSTINLYLLNGNATNVCFCILSLGIYQCVRDSAPRWAV